MKKCNVCGAEYNDDVKFCEKCGKELITEDVCPSCGKSISPGDKFCRFCGCNLGNQNNCPNCGKALEADAIFCPECGTKVDSSKTGLTANKVNKQNKNYSSLAKKIFCCLGFIAILLSFIGVFGTFIKSSDSSSVIGLSHFFGDGANNLNKIKSSYKYDEYYSFNLAMFIIENIFFFLGAVICITFSGLSLINLTKHLMGKKEIKKPYFILSTTSMLPLIIFLGIEYLLSTKENGIPYLSLTYGWGAILIIIGSSLSLLCTNILSFFETPKQSSKDKYIDPIFSTISLALIIACLFFAFSSLFTAKNTYDYARVRILTGTPFSTVASVLSSYSSEGGGKLNTAAFNPSMAAFILSIIGAFSILGAIFLMLKDKKKVAVVMTIFSLVLQIVSAVLATLGVKAFYGDYSSFQYSISAQAIVGIVFMAVSIAANIAPYFLLRNKETK